MGAGTPAPEVVCRMLRQNGGCVMKIVVLAGGISTERDVSLVTGASVCRALRENGHKAIFVDLFLGLEQVPDPLEALFDAPDGLCPDVKISAVAPDLEAVRRSRADQSARLFGPHVLECVLWQILCFWAFTGKTGKMAAFRQPLTCWESGIPAAGTWEAVWLWTNPLLR